MKTSPSNQGNGVYSNGFRQVGLETEAPLKYQSPSQFAARSELTPQLPRQPVSERFPALEKQEIILTVFAPEAAEVSVVGNFNAWRTDAARLKNTGDGNWTIRMPLRSGQYEYRFIVDGRWVEDPQATQRLPNPFGGFNSVLFVPLAVKTSIL